MQDLRLAVRNLVRKPAFSVIAILTLALGIGANAAVFTVSNAVLLSPLPYEDPEEVVILNERTPQFPSVEAVIAAVSAQMSESPDAFCTSRRGSSNLPRDLAVYVATRIAGFPHAVVKPHFGIGSESAVTKICERTARRLRNTPYLQHILHTLVP